MKLLFSMNDQDIVELSDKAREAGVCWIISDARTEKRARELEEGFTEDVVSLRDGFNEYKRICKNYYGC